MFWQEKEISLVIQNTPFQNEHNEHYLRQSYLCSSFIKCPIFNMCIKCFNATQQEYAKTHFGFSFSALTTGH